MTPLLALLAIGQVPGQKPAHPKLKRIVVSDAAVTDREARESFLRTITLLQKGRSSILGAPSIPSLNRPLMREEVVTEMARLLKALEPSFRFAPSSVDYDASKIRVAAPQAKPLESLILKGFVARVGPLVVGPSDNLTPKEFGDALGFFVSRASQLSQLPSPKWTPMLQG